MKTFSFFPRPVCGAEDTESQEFLDSSWLNLPWERLRKHLLGLPELAWSFKQ